MFEKIKIAYTENDFAVSEINHESWQNAEEVLIEKYWSGEDAPRERHFKTKFLWSDAALYVRFEANQHEPLIVSETPNLQTKTNELWNRDVCEIFLAPEPAEFRKYFEFEIAPTGEWIDLRIHQMPDERETDWNYESNMESFAKIEKDKVLMLMKIPLKSFNKIPKSGDVWKGNIFRCVGAGETRGYLTWQPTQTKEPAFHKPEVFGDFEFVR